MTNKTKTQYYYSIDDILDVKSVALVYSGILEKSKIPQYAVGVGMFENELKIDANEDGIIETVIEGMPGYEDFKFNNILILDESSSVRAFVSLSTIDVSEMGVKKITVVFEYDVKAGAKTLSMSLDYSSHISDDIHAHKHLLSKGRRGDRFALTKADVSRHETSLRNPYYASMTAFLDPYTREGYLKYSGNLYVKNGSSVSMVQGNSFFVGHGEPKGFVAVDGEQAVVCQWNNSITLGKQMLEDGGYGQSVSVDMHGMTIDGVSASLMLMTRGGGREARLYSPGDVWNYGSLDDAPYIPVKGNTKLIPDFVTGAPMLYSLDKNGYIDWEYSSESLRRTLESTLVGADGQPGVLIAATEGLSIYDDGGTPVLCADMSISNRPFSNRFKAEGFDKVMPVSARAVLLRKTGTGQIRTWMLAELIRSDEARDEYRWATADFGREGQSQSFFPSIYKLARRRETTPYTQLAFGLSYKGLLYSCPRNNIITSI